MNTFGTSFKVTTFGESHGPAVGAVIDGCPAGTMLNVSLINTDLKRRREGDPISPNLSTTRKEPDKIEWLSGLQPANKEGGDDIQQFVTLGSPITFIIYNQEARNQDYDALKNLLRPGHGDYTWLYKYGLRDHRGGGRCSARITAPWVVAGSIAKQLLKGQNISIKARVVSMGQVKQPGDTAGGAISCTVTNIPAGWGEPMADSLKARLALAMMSIPSAISFEMGIGKSATEMNGSEYLDKWENIGIDHESGKLKITTFTNHCGGVQGGISNGMPLECTVGFHPIVTLGQPIECADIENSTLEKIVINGRHDTCQIPRAVAIVEAMAALTLADFMLLNLTQS
jgi:chorismate synthase